MADKQLLLHHRWCDHINQHLTNSQYLFLTGYIFIYSKFTILQIYNYMMIGNYPAGAEKHGEGPGSSVSSVDVFTAAINRPTLVPSTSCGQW